MNLKLKSTIMAIALAAVAMPVKAEKIISVDMEADALSMLTESVSGAKLRVYGVFGAENVAGAAGESLRLDGYSSFATGNLTLPAAPTRDALTVSLWVALETYPIIKHDEATTERIILAGTLDETAKKGWAFTLGSTGKYSFVCYTGGWRTEVEASALLPRYEWSRLVVTVDGSHAVLFRNGEKVGETRCLGTIDDTPRTLYIGRGATPNNLNGFTLNTFNGLIDDLEVYDTFENAEDMNCLADNLADLGVPESRYAGDLLRPRFHGMPATAWTNETHGMTYSNGKYHVFFQKNANGPYMSRLHWGHISSPDLINWTEEIIALTPGESFDVKGCWSGCVFTDDAITGGKPAIIYTGVDYAKASIVQATPLDDDLIEWSKGASPIISGKPAGLSDDFRDPYFFRNGDNAYIIVGTSKGGVGAVTLHKYVPLAKSWTNTAGDIFFAGTDKASCGTFWEMPNITRMEGGKWLFTVTPQSTGLGVRTLYWTGTINSDGTFSPDASSVSPRGVELISKDGFGLLSPTIYQKDGKTIALGIVPDKLAGSVNHDLGWAHCYSLPREWSLDANGNLIQKPYSGLKNARGEGYSHNDFNLSGEESLDPVEGRQVELLGRFQVGTANVGFKLFQSEGSEAVVKYLPAANILLVDFSGLKRTANDGGSYNGKYSCVLPEPLAAGSELKLNVFVDGSVLDIFVNDKWATSIRVFPTDKNANGFSAFSEDATRVTELSAWNLTTNIAGIDGIYADDEPGFDSKDLPLDVFDLQGRFLMRLPFNDPQAFLPSGLYIIAGEKVMVK